jgi:hypothetical protein
VEYVIKYSGQVIAKDASLSEIELGERLIRNIHQGRNRIWVEGGGGWRVQGL